MKISPKGTPPSGRIYFFDWLRIFAFLIVVLIHCFHRFGDLYLPEGRAIDTGQGVAFTPFFLAEWSMALFFLLAGASTWFAFRRKTVRDFINERFWRLLVPLCIGFLSMVPLQTFFIMTSNQQFSGSLLEFYPFFFSNILFNGNWHWAITYNHHLWFIAYLFGYALITLPLFLYLRSDAGQIWIKRIAAITEQPGGLFTLLLPIIIVRTSLQASFPRYCSLADAICWLLFYISGFVLFANPHFRQTLQRYGRVSLGLGIAGCVYLVAIWNMGLLNIWIPTPDYSIGCLLFQVILSITFWAWLIVILNIGNACLNTNSSFLKYGCGASFSWYLIHFPITVILAYYILPLHLPVPIAFLLLTIGTLIITGLLADLLLKMLALRQAHSTSRLHTTSRQSGSLKQPFERIRTGTLYS